MESQKKQRGGDVKKAPPGYYTASQAAKRLDLNINTFRYYVKIGKIPRFVPKMRTEGFYEQATIDRMADEMKLALLQRLTENELEPLQFRVATPNDAQGIVNVLTSRGWPTTTAELRKKWYAKNPWLDHVVTQNGIIVGYFNMAPYIPEAMTAMMAGRKRGWDIRPSDILTYEPGHTYDVFVGLAEHQEAPDKARVGQRLLLGIYGAYGVIQTWARQGIRIRRMYATSNEEDGIKTAKLLSFVELPGEEGDLFTRFMLDLETSESHFARRYREAIHE